MRMYDLVNKKKHGEALSKEEIKWMIDNYVTGEIPDYQMSAMCMAIYFQGMNDEEICALTFAMAESGDMVDLSPIEGVKVDKHSTGGVGDKTTLIIGPIVAACGVKVAKMSGRGLGHTGGTIDKLESIPGFETAIPNEKFFKNVNKSGISVVGQSGNLTPADKKLYALRDVTATVDSMPMIVGSIMSKKIAAGSDCILLDVKTGSGAFMKTVEDAETLGRKMVDIGKLAGRSVQALVTDMDIPLGNAIGNSLEVIESVNTLKGNGPEDLTYICKELSATMLNMAGVGDYDECMKKVEEAITSGRAFDKLVEMVENQNGDSSVIKDVSLFEKASIEYEVVAKESGYVGRIDSEKCGIASVVLEAGRETKESEIDYASGLILNKKLGDKVEKGDVLATLYTNNPDKVKPASDIIYDAYKIESVKPEIRPLILAKIK